MTAFKNKIILITGGTGSFGNAVVVKFLSTDIQKIYIFSRDEKKQDDIAASHGYEIVERSSVIFVKKTD